LRGEFSNLLAKPLLQYLSDNFRKEFPQSIALIDFLEERKYLKLKIKDDDIWAIG
jgi:type II restriction enzyme